MRTYMEQSSSLAQPHAARSSIPSTHALAVPQHPPSSLLAPLVRRAKLTAVPQPRAPISLTIIHWTAPVSHVLSSSPLPRPSTPTLPHAVGVLKNNTCFGLGTPVDPLRGSGYDGPLMLFNEFMVEEYEDLQDLADAHARGSGTVAKTYKYDPQAAYNHAFLVHKLIFTLTAVKCDCLTCQIDANKLEVQLVAWNGFQQRMIPHGICIPDLVPNPDGDGGEEKGQDAAEAAGVASGAAEAGVQQLVVLQHPDEVDTWTEKVRMNEQPRVRMLLTHALSMQCLVSTRCFLIAWYLSPYPACAWFQASDSLHSLTLTVSPPLLPSVPSFHSLPSFTPLPSPVVPSISFAPPNMCPPPPPFTLLPSKDFLKTIVTSDTTEAKIREALDESTGTDASVLTTIMHGLSSVSVTGTCVLYIALGCVRVHTPDSNLRLIPR